MSMRDYRPGKSWIHLGGAVWGHMNGTRIHVSGMIRYPDGTIFSTCGYDRETHRYIRINGGNRKRGLMAFAVKFHTTGIKAQQRKGG